MSKSKVCVMTSVHPPFDVRIFHKQCRTLVQAGYDVTLVVPHEKDESVAGVKIRAVPKPANRKKRFIKTGYQVYRKALQINADIYHIHDPELIPYAQLLRIHHKKVIYDMHENVPRSILTKDWISPGKRKWLARLVYSVEHFLLSGLHVVFAETSYKKDYPWVANGIDVLNMPDVEYLLTLDTSKKAEHLAIGYIGGVAPERGSIAMLEGIALIQQTGINCSFHCVGPIDAQHLKELKAKIDELSLNEIHLYEYMLPAQAWDIIRQCHVGMAILKPIPNYYESYPTKMFEYMALGIPVITSNFPLYREVIENYHCGICIDPESPQAIADAIEYLNGNQLEFQEMGNNGRMAVMEKYNWKTEAKKLLTLYKELLDER